MAFSLKASPIFISENAVERRLPLVSLSTPTEEETGLYRGQGTVLAQGCGILPRDGAGRLRGFGELLLPRARADQAPAQPPAPLGAFHRVDKVGSLPGPDRMSVDRGGSALRALTSPTLSLLLSPEDAQESSSTSGTSTLQNTPPALIPPCTSPGWIHPAFKYQGRLQRQGTFLKVYPGRYFLPQTPVLKLP